MGYLSSVRMSLTKESYDFISNKLKEKVKGNRYNIFEHPSMIKEKDDNIYLGWNDIKWYEGDDEYFPDVNAIMNILHNISDSTYTSEIEDMKKYSFIYLRIGENYEDISFLEHIGKEPSAVNLDYPGIQFTDNVFYNSENSDREDKIEIIKSLEELLKKTDNFSDLVKLEYQKNEYNEIIIATFKGGGTKKANITADSGTAIIIDVINQLL